MAYEGGRLVCGVELLGARGNLRHLETFSFGLGLPVVP